MVEKFTFYLHNSNIYSIKDLLVADHMLYAGFDFIAFKNIPRIKSSKCLQTLF